LRLGAFAVDFSFPGFCGKPSLGNMALQHHHNEEEA
jgi:hypothetical protein